MGINLGSMMNNMRSNATDNGVNALNLKKNDVLNLTKKNPGLKKVILGAGWDVANIGQDFDLDIAAFLLNANGKVDPQYLPPVFTTAIVKMGTGVFSNSNTSTIVDEDITADSFVILSNYSDIIWDLNEVINVWQLTVVSNQTETGSYKYIIVNPIS